MRLLRLLRRLRAVHRRDEIRPGRVQHARGDVFVQRGDEVSTLGGGESTRVKAAPPPAARGASRRRGPPARRRLLQRRPRRAKLHEKRAGVRVTLEAALGDDERERPRDSNAHAYPRQLRQSRGALPRDGERTRSGCRPRRHLHGHVPRVGKGSGLVRGDRLGERDVELGGVERVVVAGVESTKHSRRERRRRPRPRRRGIPREATRGNDEAATDRADVP